MARYRYKIYKNNELVLTNWIDANSKEEALALLQEDHDGATIKVIETTPAHKWSC